MKQFNKILMLNYSSREIEKWNKKMLKGRLVPLVKLKAKTNRFNHLGKSRSVSMSIREFQL